MSLEAIQAISEAEEKSKTVKAEAVALSKKLIAEAEANGRLSIEEAKKKAENEILELKSKALEKSKLDALELSRNTENRKANMLVSAEGKADKAIDLVIERIVNS